MLEPENNMKTMEKLFPEMYGLVKGHWYEHVVSGSVALYTGNYPEGFTFGINPSGGFGKRSPKDWHISFDNNWYGLSPKLGDDWVNVSMDHVINMFKQLFENQKGIKIGSSVHYNHHNYIVTDDWYFDDDRLMIVCNNDVGSNVHLMLLDSSGINEYIVLL